MFELLTAYRESSVCHPSKPCRSILLSCPLTMPRADRFEVPVDFLVQQVAYLNERHQSHFRAQVRKATAAVKGSAAQSPIPGSDLAGPGHLRTPSALSIRRDVSGLRNESGTFASGTPVRPTMSRNTSATTTVMRDGGGASPRTSNKPSLRAAEQSGRTRLSSLPMESPVPRSPRSPRSPERPAAQVDSANSPGPADNSSSSSSDDDSKPAQSRIIRRPPRYQQQESYPHGYQPDEDDESEPAFQPYNAPLSSPDMSSTLKQTDSRNKPKRNQKAVAKSPYHSQTSDSSASSPAMVLRLPKTRDVHSAGPVSPRNTAEPGSSEGDHSISSSFSDLDGMISCVCLAFVLLLWLMFNYYRCICHAIRHGRSVRQHGSQQHKSLQHQPSEVWDPLNIWSSSLTLTLLMPNQYL